MVIDTEAYIVSGLKMLAQINWLEVIGFVVIVVGILIPCFLLLMAKLKAKGKPHMSVEELTEIISKPGNMFLYAGAIEELRKRDQDYSQALPNLIDMAASSSTFTRMMGLKLIRDYFPHIHEEVGFDLQNPSEWQIEQLQSIKYKIQNKPEPWQNTR